MKLWKGVKYMKTGKIGKSKVIRVSNSKKKTFIFDPGGNWETLEFNE